MSKPEYIEGEEAQKRFEAIAKACFNTPAPSKRSKELSQTDPKAVGKGLDRR